MGSLRLNVKQPLGWLLFFLFQGFLYLYFITSVPRNEVVQVIIIFSILFSAYFFVLLKLKNFSWKWAIGFSVLFRVIMLFGLPWLSDDFYRFLWDGFLSWKGLNPYLYIPSDLVENGFDVPFSLDLLNSPDFYTVYPPFGQLVFFLSNWFGNGDLFWSAFVMKFFMFLAELGSLRLIYLLFRKYQLDEKKILIYALNPLVIIEFVGNLHSEGFMIFFLLLAFWLLDCNKLIPSSIAFALSVCSKLLPLLFLPLLVWQIGWRKAIIYSFSVLVFVGLCFVPFWDENLFPSMLQSLKLYFNYLEFNASFYYLFKWLHWNVFEGALYILKLLFLITIFLIWYLKREKGNETLFLSSLFVFTAYLLSSQSIHPWYICMPLFLCVFTNYRFPIIWTFLSCFTYLTYRADAMEQIMLVVWVEYTFLFLFMIWELLFKERSYFQSQR